MSLFIYLFISYKSEEIELTDLLRIVSSTFKCYPHLNVENWYDFAIYTFRLVKSYKSFHVRPPLEILRNSSKPFSEAATGGVP